MFITFLTTEHWNFVGIGSTKEESQKNIFDEISRDFGYDLTFDDIVDRYGAYTDNIDKIIMWSNNCVAKDNVISI